MTEAIIFDLQYPQLLMDNDSAGMYIALADSSVMFEQVFKTHFKNLHGYACSILRDEVMAEEMVQNVFYKLWEKKENIHVQQSIAAYLYRAVHNECLNYIKHTKVKAVYQAHVSYTENERGDTSDPAALNELRNKIDIALNELPEQCRTVFQLSRFEDMKYREIADELGISVKTVENQMGKALRVLRTKLADYLPVLWLLFIHLKKLVQ